MIRTTCIDRERHAHLAVASNGAPTVNVARDDRHFDGGGVAGGDSAGVLAGGQAQIVDLGIRVDHGDDQAVAGVRLNDVRGIGHIVGSNRDLDGFSGGRNITGGFHAARTTTATAQRNADGYYQA